MKPATSPKITTKSRRHRRNYFNRLLATEITVKLLVNGTLLTVAISTLTNLLPYYFSQQAKLKEIRQEVTQTERRVYRLRSSFYRNFDPKQTKTVMQEQAPKVEPHQLRVFWLEKETKNR